MAILHHERAVPLEVQDAFNGVAPIVELPGHIAEYQVTDIHRESLSEPEVTQTGAHIYQELCSFYDTNGHKIVREATIGIANGNLVDVIPYPVVSTDAWTTGPRGLNRLMIRQLVDLGYNVVWLHHADQRSPLQKDKSITRSARHMHVLMDDLNGNADFAVDEVIVDGYSRAGMTGEKFIALGKAHNRKTIFSILAAPCFAEDMSAAEKFGTLVHQAPREAKGIASVVMRHLIQGIEKRDLGDFIEFAQTLNFHPKNIWHEAMWAQALINAHVGPMIQHHPKDSAGIRNFFELDEMSQLATYIDLYHPLPGIVVEAHPGPHVEGASPDYLSGPRGSQFKRLGEAILRGEKLDAMLIAEKAELDMITQQKAS